jgi:hypothetical protein
MKSIWLERVALLSPGPSRCTSTTTSGISAQVAMPMPSCIREIPGPAVAVRAFTPTMEARIRKSMAPTSSSDWRYVPPTWGRRRAIASEISVHGVMG